MTTNSGSDRPTTAELQKSTYVGRLKQKELILHEQLIEQTQTLKTAREYCDECQTAVEITMRQLEEVRHNLHILWQQAP